MRLLGLPVRERATLHAALSATLAATLLAADVAAVGAATLLAADVAAAAALGAIFFLLRRALLYRNRRGGRHDVLWRPIAMGGRHND